MAFAGISLMIVPVSCKSVAKAAAKHWTKKQIKKYKKDCKTKVASLMNEEKADQFCTCAADNISQNLDLEKANSLDGAAILKEAAKCAFSLK